MNQSSGIVVAGGEVKEQQNMNLSSISGTYENVSDVEESLVSDSEEETAEDKETCKDAIRAVKSPSNFPSGPSEMTDSETRRGILKLVTQTTLSESKENQDEGSDIEDLDLDLHHTDCEECHGSDSETESLAISESGLEKYMESASCQGTTETTESFNELRRSSDIP